jgi:hypothetical protein
MSLFLVGFPSGVPSMQDDGEKQEDSYDNHGKDSSTVHCPFPSRPPGGLRLRLIDKGPGHRGRMGPEVGLRTKQIPAPRPSLSVPHARREESSGGHRPVLMVSALPRQRNHLCQAQRADMLR